jgi:DNA-binding NtrC family response regulator
LARLIVASNRSLENEVSSGRFRADLYHRLNVIGLYLPPLRERESAITALAQSFLAEFAAREGVPVTQITPDALQCLEQYPWPGNIRELRNAIQRAVTLTDASEIRLQDLPDPVRRVAAGCKQFSGPVTPTPSRSSAASNLAGIKEEAELARLIEVLRKHGKNRRQAARELGISRTALYNKLNKYGLADFRGRGDVPVAVPHPPGVSEDVADEALAQQTAELAS